jgi:hypothetical protein
LSSSRFWIAFDLEINLRNDGSAADYPTNQTRVLPTFRRCSEINQQSGNFNHHPTRDFSRGHLPGGRNKTGKSRLASLESKVIFTLRIAIDIIAGNFCGNVAESSTSPVRGDFHFSGQRRSKTFPQKTEKSP